MRKLFANRKNEDGESGMMSVEMAFAFTMFAAFWAIIVSFLNCIYLQQKIQSGLKTAAVQLSRDYYEMQSLPNQGREVDSEIMAMVYRKYSGNLCGNYLDAQQMGAQFNSQGAIISMIRDSVIQATASHKSYRNGYILDTDYYKNMGVVGGFSGISFSKSRIDEGSGTLRVVASYRIKIMDFPLLGHAGFSVNVNQCASTKLWQ